MTFVFAQEKKHSAFVKCNWWHIFAYPVQEIFCLGNLCDIKTLNDVLNCQIIKWVNAYSVLHGKFCTDTCFCISYVLLQEGILMDSSTD